MPHAERVQPGHHDSRIRLPRLIVLDEAWRHGAPRAQQVVQAEAEAESGQPIGQVQPVCVRIEAGGRGVWCQVVAWEGVRRRCRGGDGAIL